MKDQNVPGCPGSLIGYVFKQQQINRENISHVELVHSFYKEH